ncbi:isochorismatase [Xylariaceae sp. FL0804]|nr:isochorismatase [Xylariaceae sp. FL0804]
MAGDFRPALIVVDMQEDFCPPDGSLAVPGGRDVVPVVNQLLALPFVVKVATRDWHPADHVSFAANHPGGRRPFVDTATVVNPLNNAESYETRLWPVHCVQGTAGAELVAGLDAEARVDVVLDKGTDARVEMYSPFHDPFAASRVCDSGLAELLRGSGATDVYVVGLAADYCVRAAAVDAVAEGFRTFLVEEGTRPVDADGWPDCRREIEAKGVRVVSMEDAEVRRLMTAG